MDKGKDPSYLCLQPSSLDSAPKLLLTGLPGVGKTTVVMKVMEGLGERALGFYTEEVREKGRRVGFRLVTTWGEEGWLARVGFSSPYRVSRYRVDLAFLDLVVARLREEWAPGRVLVVDEIGRMELFSPGFREWIESVALDPAVPFLATIALKSRDPLVLRLKATLPLWEVTQKNRDHLPRKVLAIFGEGTGG